MGENGGACVDQFQDFLGCNSPGRERGFFLTTEFVSVDVPLYTAVELAKTTFPGLSDYSLDMMRRVRESADITAKRFLWLALCAILPPIQDYLRTSCPVYKIDPWLRKLPGELEAFLDGLDDKGAAMCSSPYEAKYQTVDAFVAKLASDYLQM